MSSQRYQDQTRTCVDCGREYVWKASDQEYFHQKGFTAPPKRCKECRQAKKTQLGGGGQYGGGNRAA